MITGRFRSAGRFAAGPLAGLLVPLPADGSRPLLVAFPRDGWLPLVSRFAPALARRLV